MSVSIGAPDAIMLLAAGQSASIISSQDDRPKPMTASPDQVDTDGSHQKNIWIRSVLVTLGLGSVLMLLILGWIQDALISEKLELIRKVGQLQAQSAIVHVWVEELVSGDDVDHDDIVGNLDANRHLLASLAKVEASSRWSRWFRSGHDEISGLIDQADSHFQHFEKLTRVRQQGLSKGGDVGIGSEIDSIYDQTFESLMEIFRLLNEAMEQRLDKAIGLQQTLSRTIILVWIAIVVLALTMTWNHEHKRRQAELALRQSEAQLFQAQKMEALGQLAGGIAHDINNHLAAISMQCEAIKIKRGDPADTETRVNAIMKTAGKSATMIKRLLAFGRRHPIQPKIISANAVVMDLNNIFTGLISEDVDVNIQLAADLWMTTIDPLQLEQIVLNLVVNASEAMPRGGVLTIKTSNRPGDAGNADDRMSIEISDTGDGIQQAAMDRIFEPFFTTKIRPATAASALQRSMASSGKMAVRCWWRAPRTRVRRFASCCRSAARRPAPGPSSTAKTFPPKA